MVVLRMFDGMLSQKLAHVQLDSFTPIKISYSTYRIFYFLSCFILMFCFIGAYYVLSNYVILYMRRTLMKRNTTLKHDRE